MAEAKRPPLPKILTPKGRLIYPKLTAPDTFKGKSTYNTKILLKGSDPQAQALVTDLKAKAEAFMEEQKATLQAQMADAKGPAKAKLRERIEKLKLFVPIKPDYNDEGEETGDYVLSAKMNASYEDKKTGKTKTLKPSLVDARGNEIKKDIEVWGGTIAKVSANVLNTYVEATGDCGVSLRLRGVQIIELVSGGRGAAGDFEDEGEGYVADEEFGESSESSGASDEDEQF